jgi:uncharacterized protein (TIGR03435 family)
MFSLTFGASDKRVTVFWFFSVGFLVASVLRSQPVPADRSEFEVASVKITGSSRVRGMRGGPGSSDPEQITYSGVPIKEVLKRAYGVRTYQLAGPDWLDTVLYDISAKIAAGTTAEQFQIMLQNLLKERFDLVLHHESREAAVYELVVGRNGPKLTRAAEAGQAQPASTSILQARDGFPIFLPAILR